MGEPIHHTVTFTMQEFITNKIVCTVSITLVKRADNTRGAHAQVIGPVSEIIMALKMAGEQSRELRAAIIGAGSQLATQFYSEINSVKPKPNK